jgi:FtsP/CotA-like multicopper oxidase with cupredoxin domain
MARRINRRELGAGLAAAILAPALPGTSAAQGAPSLGLEANPGQAALRPGGPETPIWSLVGSPSRPGDFKYGDRLEVTLSNDLPVPAALTCRGIDGVAGAEPLGPRAPVSPGARASFVVPRAAPGTFTGDIRLLEDGQARPSRAVAFVVQDREPLTVDRDELFLIEDWRLRPDGSAVTPGTDPKDAIPLFTINGLPAQDLSVRPHERLRLRLVSGCQRGVIALQLEGCDIRVMAIDSVPAEPFFARNGTLVLAPGTRVDAFVDTAAPGSASAILLHDGKEMRTMGRLIVSEGPPASQVPLPEAPALRSEIPAHLDLKNAFRTDLTLGGTAAGWVAPAKFSSSRAPAFRAKLGRTVVVAISNRGIIPEIFHLHGHHFRLLDRLDDGWKPFWLDTLVIEAGQTHRIAFAARYPGSWLMESTRTDWAAPRLISSYRVE